MILTKWDLMIKISKDRKNRKVQVVLILGKELMTLVLEREMISLVMLAAAKLIQILKSNMIHILIHLLMEVMILNQVNK